MRKIKLLTGVSLVVFALNLVMVASVYYKAEAAGEEKTIVGYVRDPYCLLGMGAKGEAHRECAIACAKGGIALAIEDEKSGKLYTALPDKDRGNPNEKILNFAERKVKVTGTVFEGSNFIMIKKVEAVK